MGGLRLTAPLFEHLASILDRLERASELAGTKAILSGTTVERLRAWYVSLGDRKSSGTPTEPKLPAHASGELMIFAPGSTVGVRFRGALQERCLLRPEFARVGDDDILGYHYSADNEISGWVPHEQIEPIGHLWRQALWNSKSDGIRELAA